MNALRSFRAGVRKGKIRPERSERDKDLFLFTDRPDGRLRVTCVRMSGQVVTAMALLAKVHSHNGKPCFQIGYAVPERLRRQGRGKDIAQAAIVEARYQMEQTDIAAFYIEAVVDAENIASRKIAEALTGSAPKAVIDAATGVSALQYIALVPARC
jgi:predicted acetyltransferase